MDDPEITRLMRHSTVDPERNRSLLEASRAGAAEFQELSDEERQAKIEAHLVTSPSDLSPKHQAWIKRCNREFAAKIAAQEAIMTDATPEILRETIENLIEVRAANQAVEAG